MVRPWMVAKVALLAYLASGASGVEQLQGMDANGKWWPVTIIREHLDGTVACRVEDGFGTQWPITHRANLKVMSPTGHLSEPQPELQPDLQPEPRPDIIEIPAATIGDAKAPRASAAAAALSKVWQVVTGGLLKASAETSAALAELQVDLALDMTLCHSHAGCRHLGSEGTQCCPTQDGVTLECCYDASYEPEPEVADTAPAKTPVKGTPKVSVWTSVGAERADLVGHWGYGNGSFELTLAGDGQLRFEETDARIPGGSASGMVFISSAQGDAALPTARITAGGSEIAALRIRRLHGVAAGDKIGIEIMRSGDRDWNQHQEIIAARMPAW